MKAFLARTKKIVSRVWRVVVEQSFWMLIATRAPNSYDAFADWPGSPLHTPEERRPDKAPAPAPAPTPVDVSPPGPAPMHPERLVPDVALTPMEALLFEDLTDTSVPEPPRGTGRRR